MLLALGCAHTPPGSVAQAPRPELTAADDANHTFHASTYVSFGDLRAGAALQAGDTPGVQEQLRDEARRAYAKALEVDPNCLAAYRSLGRLYQARGDYDRAVETYRGGLRRLPKADALWFDFGLCQARHRQLQPAIDSMRRAWDLNHQDPGYAKALGFCLCRAGRYDEGFDCLKQVMSEAQAHYDVARVQHAAGDDPGCRVHLQAALALRPDLSLAREMLAQLDGPAPSAPATPAPQPAVQAIAATPNALPAPAPQPPVQAVATTTNALPAPAPQVAVQPIATTTTAPPAEAPQQAVVTVGFDQLDDDMLKDSDDAPAKIGPRPR
jgi:tetratricopeptide (TPR) repeat protein